MSIQRPELPNIEGEQPRPAMATEKTQELKDIAEVNTKIEELELIAERHGLEPVEAEVSYPVFDGTKLTAAELSVLLEDMESHLDLVLHGGSAALPHQALDPTISSLTGKPSSVYGSADPKVALMNAVIIKNGELRDQDAGIGISSSMTISDKGRKIFKAPHNMYEAIKSGRPEVFADGYVYVCSRSDWTPSNGGVFGDSDHEYNSQDLVSPLVAIRVSSEIGPQVLVAGRGEELDTVRESHTQADIDRLMEEKEQRAITRFVEGSFPEDRQYSANEVASVLLSQPGAQGRLSEGGWREFLESADTDSTMYSRQGIAELIQSNRS